MKRILCLIENLGSGGAERQLTGLAVMLKQQGYDVDVCYYVQKEFYLPYLQDNRVVATFLPDALTLYKRFGAIRQRVIDFKPDTVISYSASTSIITCLLKFLGLKYNLIVSERNTTQQLTLSEKLKFFVYRWADYVVPNSFAQGEYIHSIRPNLKAKIKVITNYVDNNKFKPSLSPIVDHDELRVICVGRMMPQKNIIRFIHVISELVSKGYNIKVIWYGQDLKDEYSVECHNAVKKYSLEHILTFHSPSLTIQEEYCKADVFCLPSLYEGFPNVLCEAMSCGKPVLSSRVSDTPKIVQDGMNGFLFNPLSIEDMVNTIQRYIELPNFKKIEMGEKSREISIGMFSMEKFLSNYLELL